MNTRLRAISNIAAILIAASVGFAFVTVFRNSMLASILRDLIPIGLTGFTMMSIATGMVGNALILYVVRYPKGTISYLTVTLLFWGCLLLIAFNWILTFWEFITYHNFVFGEFGIFLPIMRRLVWTYVVTFGLITFYSVNSYRNATTKIILAVYEQPFIQNMSVIKFMRNNTLLTVLSSGFPYLVALYLVGTNLSEFPAWLKTETKLFFTNVQLAPEDRYELGMKEFHIEMEFVADNTPEDAIIFHPLQSVAFPTVGNQVLIRYHLYPRRLVSDPLINDFLEDYPDTKVVYTVLDIGYENLMPVLYPPEPIQADEVRILMLDNSVQTYDNQRVDAEWVDSLGDFQIGVIRHTL